MAGKVLFPQPFHLPKLMNLYNSVLVQCSLSYREINCVAKIGITVLVQKWASRSACNRRSPIRSWKIYRVRT